MTAKQRNLTLRLVALALFWLLPSPRTWPQTGVTLSSSTTPSTGQAAITIINVIGSNFPSGTIRPADVTVTVQPASYGPPSGTKNATAVVSLYGSSRRVASQIPPSISASTPTAYLISIAGKPSTGVSFASTNGATLTINPPPA